MQTDVETTRPTPTPLPAPIALPFSSHRAADGSITFLTSPPPGVSRVEVRIDEFLVGAAGSRGGEVTVTRLSGQDTGHRVEIRGLDARGVMIAIGNGLIDGSAPPGIYVDQRGASEYEIGIASPGLEVATVEVTADGYPLTDLVSGRFRSTRAAIRHAFAAPGTRALVITTRDHRGYVIATQDRTLHVR